MGGCPATAYVGSGVKLYYHCFTFNEYGNTWTNVRIGGTEIIGWKWGARLNNYGWVSIRDLQLRGLKKRVFGTEFAKHVDFEKLTKAYGAEYRRAEKPEELKAAVRQATSSDSVSVVETIVDRRFPDSGTFTYGHWDIPTPYS